LIRADHYGGSERPRPRRSGPRTDASSPAAVGLFCLWHVATTPVSAVAHERGIAYDVHIPAGYVIAVAYVIATCGPALLSSRTYLRWFGAINLVAAGVAATVNRIEFASVWCLYAALASS
jgi:hypothetical protein